MSEHSTKRDRKTMNGADIVQTPPYALGPLIPYLKRRWMKHIWEPCDGQGKLTFELYRLGFEVTGTDILRGWDFLTCAPFECDAIITNPPYSEKDEFIARCFEIGRPWALLLPTESIGGVARGQMFKEHGIEIIVPHQRIDFIMPEKQGTAWFHTSWFTWGLGIGSALTFVDLPKPKES